MKIFFAFLFFFVANGLFGQTDRTRYSLQYSLNRADATGYGPAQYFDPGVSHNIFMIAELASRRTSRFTIGAGFLHTKLISSYMDYSTNETTEEHSNNHYWVIPGGVKFSFGSFFIHPEIAATYNYCCVTNLYAVDVDMNIADEPYEIRKRQASLEILFASFMTIGYEIKLGSSKILTGLKGYYTPSNLYVNTFGIGVMVGVKI